MIFLPGSSLVYSVTENHKEQLDDLKPSVVETAESKPVKQTPSTWAALFKSTLPPQSSKAPIIVSVQVEQSAKEERKLAADSNDEGPVTSVQKDKKARALAGIYSYIYIYIYSDLAVRYFGGAR